MSRWFLPDTPDVLGTLRGQLAVTIEGVDAFRDWAAAFGEDGPGEAAASRLQDAEHRGNAAARALLGDLRAAFVTPLEPEDLFALSRGIDRVLDYAHDVVGEARVMATKPDAGVVEIAALLAEAVRDLDAALAGLGDGDRAAAGAVAAADRVLATVARLDAAYGRGMAALLEVEDRAERIGRRELYRRCERIGEVVAEVAERVVYAVVKQS